MLDHHLQRRIVYSLAFSPSLRFSELKPDDIENKLFDYHLKKVVKAGLVSKNPDGRYSLTAQGRKLGVHIFDRPQALADQAYSVLFLVIRRKSDNSWLLYKRLVHPLIGRCGFMHAQPVADEKISVTARQIVSQKTGLNCDFHTLGSGYFRVFDKGDLESFTHFTLLFCDNAEGKLKQSDEFAEYYWVQDPDFSAEQMLPNMKSLSELYLRGEGFFVEETFQLN